MHNFIVSEGDTSLFAWARQRFGEQSMFSQPIERWASFYRETDNRDLSSRKLIYRYAFKFKEDTDYFHLMYSQEIIEYHETI